MRQLLAIVSWGLFLAMIGLMFVGTLPVTVGRIVAVAIMLIIAAVASIEGRDR